MGESRGLLKFDLGGLAITIFDPPGDPLGVPHCKAPRSNFKKSGPLIRRSWGTWMGAGKALDGKELGGPLIRRSWEGFGRSSEGVGESSEGLGGSWEGL